MNKLKVFLADDHVLVRAGVRALINAEPDLLVIGEATDAGEAIEQIIRSAPDVAIVDVSMPPCGGGEITRRIRQAHPQLKVLALTMHEERNAIAELLAAGAAGYILKRAAAVDLIGAIRAVAQGGMYLDPRVASKMIALGGNEAAVAADGLSQRESDVLRAVARGYSHKEIAAQLGVSLKTVDTYKVRAMDKLRLKTRVDVIRHAAAVGWLQPALA